MFAIFKIKNQQFLAKKGDIITANFNIESESGTLDVKDIQYSDSDITSIKLTILKSGVKNKVVSVKKRRRKASMRKYGAKNYSTTLKFESVENGN